MGRRWMAVLWGLLLLLLAAVGPASAQGPIQVGVVLQDEEGSVATYCVTLAQRNPTGYDALLATGLDVEASVSAQGVAVCRIGETGCPAQDCFCRCQGATCEYWAYSILRDGTWQTATTGAGGRLLAPGDVDGWRWGAGDPPPAISFAEICSAQAGLSDSATGGAANPEVGQEGGALSVWVPVAAVLGVGALALILSRRKRP